MANTNFPEMEEKILKFWKDNKIFEKSVNKKAPHGDYVFYDGPPFATGLPHYGHILSSVIKDVVPRYWTMKGYSVPRRWGWDCHGLPIENIVEKELKISGKKQIESIGIDKFNETCRDKVLTYTSEWKKMVDRIGRWVDFDNSYKTMDSTYMESVWWAVKTIRDKGLIYEGRKVLMYCPRCETPVSKAEVAMDDSYRNIVEESVTVKFKVKNPAAHNLPENTFILAWTTTPWTLPANVALAVGKEIIYVLVKQNDEYYLLAHELVDKIITGDYSEEKKIPGADLIGIEYEPLIDIPSIRKTGKPAWYVTDADFVTTADGTGVVHTAVVYGEDDYNLGLKKDLPVVPLLDEKGIFNADAPELIRGQYFKDSEKIIKNYLTEKGLLFAKQNFTHSYPHCWRCDTQLFYNAISAWFINIQKIKSRLIKLNEKINWYPDNLKHGRFLNILETAPDWNISRNRYWATPLPFWKCDNPDCRHQECIGSLAELKNKAINYDAVYSSDDITKVDLHKHLVDQIKLKCVKCGGSMTRIPEVIDCWVESSSMPFAEHHYPFENEKVFKSRFPGQYIAEYIAQTRAWFYYMHVMATLLFNDISFENCICTGTILNEKGEKLSKSKRNYTDPWEIINLYGVDALRYYLMSSVVMQAENLFFNDKEVKDVYNKVLNILNNVKSFYQMYADDNTPSTEEINHVLDKWIYARLQQLIATVTLEMDNYNTVKATRPIKDFIDDLSTWYLRRSRDRFKGDDEQDKLEALTTLRRVLVSLAKIMAPFMPFTAEKIYLDLTANRAEAKSNAKESVHLEVWPEIKKELLNIEVLTFMATTKKIVEAGLAARASAGIKIRQPLTSYSTTLVKKIPPEYIEIVKDELNILELKFGEDKLDTELTEELRARGLVREIVRTVNSLRKESGLSINDRITLYYDGDESAKKMMKEFDEKIKKDTLSDKIKKGKTETPHQKEIEKGLWLGIIKN